MMGASRNAKVQSDPARTPENVAESGFPASEYEARNESRQQRDAQQFARVAGESETVWQSSR